MSLRILILLSLLVTACSPPADPVATDTAGADGAGEPDTVRWETVPSDLPGDLSPDALVEDLAVFDEASPCEPGTGCFGDSCDTGADCLSGYCVLHMGERICSDLCVEECPAGFECRQVAQAEPDVVFICASRYPALCLPCATDAECSDLAGPGSSCIDYGPGGHFCGVVCAAEADCPGGTVCDQVATVEGLLTAQCVHEAGACPCTAYAVATGAAALCSNENEHGTCSGMRTCTGEGLTPCDAATPGEELCNGQDDDCDGATDEVDCDDGNACTADLCEGAGGCTHVAATGGECLDGDACTIGDHCEAGACVGSPLSCNDGNGCTVETCAPQLGCLYEYTTDPCNDGDPCSVGDTCLAGTCVGLPGACECQDDGDCLALVGGDLCVGQWYCSKARSPFQCLEIPNSAVVCPGPVGVDQHCYDQICQPDTGDCVEVPINGGGPCEDGDACTVPDICNVGACVSGPGANCNDGNPCTDDACNPASGCVSVLNSAPCDDGDACTVGDVCSQGACVPGQPMACDDGNPCTADACVAGLGCQYAAIDGACSDGNACTTGDHCAGGWCVPQGVIPCDDGNPCTDDSCTLGGGCVHAVNNAPCDDGDLCTLSDVCSLGSCLSGQPLACSDGNPCTADSCVNGIGCQYAPVGGGCDDANACTTGDHCVGGWCVPAGMLACDDGNPCTDDSCAPSSGCVNAPNVASCDDGDACTLVDTCAAGSCVGAGAPGCDDADACTQDTCDPGIGCINADIVPCCGNGDEEPGEECDDGNHTPGDGCSEVCDLEVGNCSNGSTVDCNPPGTTLIQSSRFVDPDPPNGWTQCAGFVNTGSDDVSNTFLNNCLNTNRLRVRAWNGGSLEEDVYSTNMSVGGSWPDWNYLGGSITKLSSTYWTGSTTYFTTGKGNDACSTSCCNAAPAGTMTLGTGNGSSVIVAPGNTNALEWRVSCGGQALSGRKIAFYR
ncbi:MAG: hypothetical protein ABIK09_07455 [Pseudomonadota bacterium]